MNKIFDKFTDLPVSPQRKYQLRNIAKGLCIICGDKLHSKNYCLKCAKIYLERDRKKLGSKKRYLNARIYQA